MKIPKLPKFSSFQSSANNSYRLLLKHKEDIWNIYSSKAHNLRKSSGFSFHKPFFSSAEKNKSEKLQLISNSTSIWSKCSVLTRPNHRTSWTFWWVKQMDKFDDSNFFNFSDDFITRGNLPWALSKSEGEKSSLVVICCF